MKQSTKFNQSPARFLSTTQYQYDPYTGEDSFTPDNEGCDFNHWLITMNFPKDNVPSREEMISIFEQTCAKGLGIRFVLISINFNFSNVLVFVIASVLNIIIELISI